MWIVGSELENPAYDFHFDRFFPCRRPRERPETVTAIGRIGAPTDYAATFDGLLARGIRLVNDPAQHRRASELPCWYPLLSDVTPRSAWYASPPSAAEIGGEFGWPVFVKGARQTARHDAKLSIARGPAEYAALRARYETSDILHWQHCVVREYVELRALGGGLPGKVPYSFEYRTFWWHGELVGSGPYWTAAKPYSWTTYEEECALQIGSEAASRLDVPFVVIDLAMAASGAWVVIECNDAQESGYAGVSPFQLWNNILAAERKVGG